MIGLQSLLLLTSYAIVAVRSHGYASYPVARQYRCYSDGGFYWPPNGDGVPDEACRESFKHVYNKYYAGGYSESVASAAAQYMFQQYSEYAALAGGFYEDQTVIETQVVPNNLCSAGAIDKDGAFGDKTGMSKESLNWRRTTIQFEENETFKRIEFRFCPTAVHEPSFFKVYISKPDFDGSMEQLTWFDLTLLNHTNSHLVPNRGDEYCSASQLYSIYVTLPYREGSSVIYFAWQRIDPVGEGFYNCADIEMIGGSGSNGGADSDDETEDDDTSDDVCRKSRVSSPLEFTREVNRRLAKGTAYNFVQTHRLNASARETIDEL